MEKDKNRYEQNNQPVITKWDTLKKVPFAGAEVVKQKEYRSLEELGDILKDEKFMVWGHGTGRRGNSEEVVQSIFKKGMIASGNGDGWGLSNPENRTDLSGNAVPLDVEDNDKLTEQLNNWGHLDSKNIILIRIPTEGQVLTTAFYEERYYPFYTEEKDENGDVKQVYLDHRFIVGCYNAERGNVEMNPYFESEPSEELERQITERKAYVEDKIAKRNEELEKNPFGFARGGQGEVLDLDSAEENFDDSGWEDDWE